MKQYKKPQIVEEQILIEDIIALSGGTQSTNEGKVFSLVPSEWEEEE